MESPVTIAISKGRIMEESVPLLKKVGLTPLEEVESTRKLIVPTENPNVRLLIIRASDVPTYVQYGAADLGIAGKDVLLELDGEGLYELLDLGISRCRLMVAGYPDRTESSRRLRIATKYVRSAQEYFARQGKQVEIIKLYGSMELAPIMGLADQIVDLVATGSTLKANGLAPIEHITDISSRLVANKTSMKVKFDTLHALIENFRSALTRSV